MDQSGFLVYEYKFFFYELKLLEFLDLLSHLNSEIDPKTASILNISHASHSTYQFEPHLAAHLEGSHCAQGGQFKIYISKNDL
jgi:hypothetical protein